MYSPHHRRKVRRCRCPDCSGRFHTSARQDCRARLYQNQDPVLPGQWDQSHLLLRIRQPDRLHLCQPGSGPSSRYGPLHRLRARRHPCRRYSGQRRIRVHRRHPGRLRPYQQGSGRFRLPVPEGCSRCRRQDPEPAPRPPADQNRF